ncbi:hypothetical protein C8J55DRAFT_518762 [Lentinula edodes]|uniref:F-box domain-containing protein n=1 Tax=Lentinula lateritia TaxID=40482 RepID=A0A9W9A4C2_9AGAR|nr:hypothetical protein C8J55DRAFT_518762 [Lentinula edodes]
MKKARALVSPIQRLPPEILCFVFLEYIHNVPKKFKQRLFFCSLVLDEEKSLYCPTVQLTWVCSLWRKVVLGCPLFWSLAASVSLAEEGRGGWDTYMRQWLPTQSEFDAEPSLFPNLQLLIRE